MEKLISLLENNQIPYCVKFQNNVTILIINFKDESSLSLIEKDKCKFLYNE